MTRRCSLAHILTLLVICIVPVRASGQAYLFGIPEMRMEIFVNPDASVRLEYEIIFENTPHGRPIDAVDVGLFHENYEIRNMSASLDGTPLPRIRPSPYVTGVEVNLGRRVIGPRERAVFRFTATMPDMVYQDTTRDDYASLQFTPTWFDQRFVLGNTNLRMAVHLLPVVEAEEVLYHDVPFSGKALYGGRAVAFWESPNARMVGPHRMGLSFPKTGMERVVSMSRWELLVLWWEGSPGVQMGSGMVILVLFAAFFFRLTGGTGWSLFFMVGGIGGWLFFNNPVMHLVSLPFWPFIFALMWYPARRAKQRPSYLPPIASVEGGGVKRGLTAPEAAVLLEMKPGKVVTLVVFGLLKKKVFTLTNEEPLSVEVAPGYEKERPSRLEVAAENGIVLHAYEHGFIEAVSKNTDKVVGEADFSAAVKGLIDHVVGRMTGFDLDETKQYYQYIIKRAWSEAESIGEVELRDKTVDKNLEWLLLDDGYRDGFGRWERSGYRYRPLWIGYGRPRAAAGSGLSGRGALSAARASGSASPTFGDVAGSFAGWTENVAGQAASSIMPSSIGARTSVLDLSGADSATKSFFDSMSSRGSSGGFGGGCACAGCACACACAGGGR